MESPDNRPAYVRRMDGELRGARAELEAIDAGLRALHAYLCSPKFFTDRSVNVNDVLLRLDETRSAALQARGEA